MLNYKKCFLGFGSFKNFQKERCFMKSEIFAKARRVFQNPVGFIGCIVPILLGTIFSLIGSFGGDLGMKEGHSSWLLMLFGALFSVAFFITFFIFESIIEAEDA